MPSHVPVGVAREEGNVSSEAAAYAQGGTDGCHDGADEVPEELDEFFLVIGGHK